VQSLVDAGKLTVLALASQQRLSFVPDWPTFAENGFPIEAEVWVGLYAPAGTPPAVNKVIAEEVGKILQQDDTRKLFSDLGTDDPE
jgi:tripartite-type tricarboxylate transporter receptor subunit TctC